MPVEKNRDLSTADIAATSAAMSIRQELCHETTLIVLRIINESILDLSANSRIKDVEIFYAHFMYLIQ